MPVGDRVVVAPITDRDVDQVSAFLHREMNQRITPTQWAAAMRAPWQHEPPNHGFLLRAGDEVVGAYLALYSLRRIADRDVMICNLAAWCVGEHYRFKGLRLLYALIAQPGYHFVDLSPSGNVIALNERLGFEHLDTRTVVVVNLPWPTRPGRVRVVTGAAQIDALLDGEARRIYRDHADAPGVAHLAVNQGGATCHVMYRRVRRKNLAVFASIVHVSDLELFRRSARLVTRHLLLRHAIPLTLFERRITACEPRPHRVVRQPRPKMFRSDDLRAEEVDDLYSELVALAW